MGGQVAPERMELVASSCISRSEIAVCAPREPIPGSRSIPAEPKGRQRCRSWVGESHLVGGTVGVGVGGRVGGRVRVRVGGRVGGRVRFKFGLVSGAHKPARAPTLEVEEHLVRGRGTGTGIGRARHW